MRGLSALVSKMVATRRGTRAEPQEEGEQTPEKVISPTSPIHTRSSAKKGGQNGNLHKSALTSGSPRKSGPVIHGTHITTRSNQRSGQSDADVSEAESPTSNNSTRRSLSRQSLGQLTDSTRKLRSHRPALITEPIIESKEDVELSDAGSDCSSVSTSTRRKPLVTTPRSISTRSRKSHLLLEPTSDVSDEESNSSPVSGLRIRATRSSRSSSARTLSFLVKEPQKEQTSDAESFTSGFSTQPLARRSSRRNKSNSQSEEVANESTKEDASDQETLKKQSPKVHNAQSSVAQENVLSSIRRSSRNRPAIKKGVISQDEPESSDAVTNVLDVEEANVKESSMTKDVDLPEETIVASSVQSSETQPEEHIIADQGLRPSPDPMDEEHPMEKSAFAHDNDATEEKNENLQHVQESVNMDESSNICLIIDSDSDSEKSEHSDHENNLEVEQEEENEQQKLQDVSGDDLFAIDTTPVVESSKKTFVEPKDDVAEKGETTGSEEDEDSLEEEDNYEQIANKRKSKKASEKQQQDVSGDGIFVIDTAPGVDSSKKYFLEPDDDDDEDVESDVDDMGETPGSDEDNSMEEEDSYEQIADKRKSKKASEKQLQDVSGDGIFVIDTAPGVDSGKKYFLEPEDKNEADVKGKTPESEDDHDEEEDFIDEDEDEEETLLNRPKSGFVLSTSIDTGIRLKEMGGLYISFDAEKPNPGPSLLSKMKKGNAKKDELLQKSVITPDFEKKESVPPYIESQRKLKKLRKEERAKTTGRGWFDMKAPELTDELKNDLKALKMRSAMDPKHFYKKNDRDGFPKHFEVGTVVDNPIDYYHSRIPKKERKRTIVEELLADAEFRRYNKKKFKEIIAEKAARAEGKKNRKKKKFRT